MASNPVPLLSPPPDSSSFLDRIGSEFDDEDADELESNSTSHPTSPEKLDIVSTSSFVFDRRSGASSRSAQHESASPHYDPYARDAANGYLPTGSAVGGTTIVQEEIETIITTEGVSDPQLHGSASSHSSSCLFPDSDETLNKQLDAPVVRVPFPELGLDLVDIHLFSLFSEEERAIASSEIRLTELKSWDENWLFKQRKKKPNSVSSYFAFADLDFASEPVRMLIPNPSQEAKTSIGQQTVDDLTDLSEKNSVASLSFSSDSESESEAAESSDRQGESAPLRAIMSRGGPDDKSSATSANRVAEADHKPPAAHQQADQRSVRESRPNESGEGKSSRSSLCPAPSPVTFPGQETGVTITAAKESRYAGKLEQRHDLSSPSSGIALPSFVPLSRRMESSRSDPCFVIKPCGASVQTAILVQFCCRVKGSRPLGVAWFKGDHLLTDSDCFRIFSSGNEFVLEIRCTQVHHSDIYSCVVYNGFGEQWSDFSLTVKERAWSPVTGKAMTRTTPVAREDEQPCQDRGIDIEFFRAGKSPRIITQTWAERSAVGRDGKEAKVTTAAAIQRESSPNGPVMTGSGSPIGEDGGTSLPDSEKESKWSKSAISWPAKPHCEDGLRKRIPPAQRPVIFSSALRRGSGDHVGRGSGAAASPRTESGDDEAVVGESGIVSLSSRCKDYSVYKRDYFVPSAKDETLNGLDEKVYETSKFFPLQEDEKEDGNSSADETSILTAGSPSVAGSLTESYLSQKDSGQGDERDSSTAVDDEDETDDAEERGGVSPSVRKLVRRFSRKEAAAGVAKRCCTYASCSNLYEDCDGKGVTPMMHADDSPEVHSPVARSLHKFFRERNSQCAPSRQLNRFGSFSMCDIDQIARPMRSGGIGSTATVSGSPTNEGYNSDDSALSANTSLKNKINDCLKSADGSVEVMPTKKVSRTIMKRASFWQNRCEKGLLSDSSVAEEFPGMECICD